MNLWNCCHLVAVYSDPRRRAQEKKWASWLLDFQIKMYKIDIDLETLDMFLKILEISMTWGLPPGTKPLPPPPTFKIFFYLILG